ncbi:50S ribosomal protein L4 [bacterium]|nr:50S ribosomal protein L4 [bacterium]
MPRVNVLDQNGEKVSTLNLAKEVFAIEPNEQAMFDAVQVALSNRRQDTAKTKTRAEVRGGGRKPWRQKGTGRARHGSTRSPQWRHGGVAFGPTGEQDHSIKMNKKERVLALKSILSAKLAIKELTVVDKFEFAEPKTKAMEASLKALGLEGKKTLIVMSADSMNDEALLSVLNLPKVGLLYFFEINVYDVMNAEHLVLTKEAAKILGEVLGNGAEGK